MLRHTALSLLFVLGAAGCKKPASETTSPSDLVKGIHERAGLLVQNDPYGDSATKLVYLEQSWGPAETLWFYHADQGSVLMPYDMLIHLEKADSEARLASPENLVRYRFLNQHKTPNNPDALPIGFAKHKDKVGLTCAACHTAQINYKGTAMRIDGAPAMLNVSAFFQDIEAAISATLSDNAKLARFASATKSKTEDAQKSLNESLTWFRSYNKANSSSVTEGFGRLDAIGRIINQVIRFTSGPENSLPPNAPASFPLLWDTPRLDFVQWAAFAPNSEGGSLGRNAGEVVGVFGDLEVVRYTSADEAKKGYDSTIQGHELVSMEESLRGLTSPLWPEDILPAIDRTLAKKGEALYQKECVSCHELIDRDDPKRLLQAQVYGIDKVGTDPTAAKNLVYAEAPSGKLEGAVSPMGGTYQAREPALALLGDLVTRVLSAQPVAAVKAISNSKLHGLEKTTKKGDYTQDSPQSPNASMLSYKARALNGIWASSPYLHNGSVPTLYDLLLPVSQRPARFSTGRWEYDPQKVGYIYETGPSVIDTSIAGNSNKGHEYGVSLSEEERWALVEYLKTL